MHNLHPKIYHKNKTKKSLTLFLILFITLSPVLKANNGGYLVIRALEQSMGNRNYTSGRIVTRPIRTWTYGRVEAKIRLPVGQALWPAFWMMPDTEHSPKEPPDNLDGDYGQWPASGEIDIMEARGSNIHEISGALHYIGDGGNHTYTSGNYSNITISDFNVYAIEWSSASIKWYANDVKYMEVTADTWNEHHPEPSPAPFDKPFYIIFNLAIGGNFFDPSESPVSSDFPADMVIEYVRVYQGGLLVWEDNFEGTELDGNDWNYEIGTGSQYSLHGWGNSELQYYTDSSLNVFVSTFIPRAPERKEEGPKVFSEKPYNLPNPFSPGNGGTVIKFELDQTPSDIKVEIFSSSGYRVFSKSPALSRNPEVVWDGRNNNKKVASGIYILKVEVETESGDTDTEYRKILVLR